jgi:hypothetical protein
MNTLSEFRQEILPGVQARVLDPNHPDPVYPLLGLSLEDGCGGISLKRSKFRRALAAGIKRSGVVGFPELTDKQRGDLDTRAYTWMGVPERSPYTQFPHYDRGNGRNISVLRRVKPIPTGVTIAFSGFLPACRALRKALPQIMRCPADSTWKVFIKDAVGPFKRLVGNEDIYTPRGAVYPFVREMVNSLRVPMETGSHPQLIETIRAALAPDALHVDLSQYELLAFDDGILHYGEDGLLNDALVFEEV